MMPEEFCERYRDGLHVGGIAEGDEREVIGQARTVFGLSEKDLVLGVHKVLSGLFKSLLYSNVLAGFLFPAILPQIREPASFA